MYGKLSVNGIEERPVGMVDVDRGDDERCGSVEVDKEDHRCGSGEDG